MKTVFSLLLGVLTGLLVVSCQHKYDVPVPVPTFTGSVLTNPNARLLSTRQRLTCEGVYRLAEGADQFGQEIVLKWSYLISGRDTTYQLSAFCGTDAAFFILDGRQLGDSVVFEGYWRKLVNTRTGLVHLTIAAQQGASCTTLEKEAITLTGTYGENEAVPARPLTLSYDRPLNQERFEILAHRSGGRTADLLPASENTVEMIRLAPRLGATGIEVDVRLTKDGVPIIYHDNTLNLRLIQKNGLVGGIEDYTYEQLNTLVRLKNGERIPKLTEALDAVLLQTPLRFVWLDTKYVGSMQILRTIQQTYLVKAAALGRAVDIIIGLPDADKVVAYEALPDRSAAPALCELDTATVRRIDARIWAPAWTRGLQVDLTDAMHAEGRRVFVWTLDVADFIRQYRVEGHLDGILSNYPSLVAYYHYTQP